MFSWPGPHSIAQCTTYEPATFGVNVTCADWSGLIAVKGIPRLSDWMPCTPDVEVKCSVTGFPTATAIVFGVNFQLEATMLMTAATVAAGGGGCGGDAGTRPNATVTVWE